MTRTCHIFDCKSNRLVGSLDSGYKQTGLLIVSGGNEVRSGPWGSQALLAEAVAAAGHPVFRFDRRGVGDSEGHNAGFADSADDIAAAVQEFRRQVPGLERVVGYGNCDGATALMLAGGTGFDALVLANPWTIETAGAERNAPAPTPAMTPQRLRAHYLRRLADPRAWLRLVTGKTGFGSLSQSLVSAAAAKAPPTKLFTAATTGLARFGGPVRLLVAGRDRTGLTFLDYWDPSDPRVHVCDEASHSFVEPAARAWLESHLLAALQSV